MSRALAITQRQTHPKGRKKKPILTASKTLRQMFEIIDGNNFSGYDLAVLAGLGINSISYYRRGRTTPNILAVESMVAAMGYKLELVPIDS